MAEAGPRRLNLIKHTAIAAEAARPSINVNNYHIFFYHIGESGKLYI